MTVQAQPLRAPQRSRFWVAAAFASALSLPFAHAFAALLRNADPASAHAWAWPLSLAALALSPVGVWLADQRRGGLWAALVGAGAVWLAGLLGAPTGPWRSLLPTALVAFAAGRFALARMPASIEPLRPGSRVRAGLWLLVVAVAVLQLARLSTWISDPESNWFLTTGHPFWAKHECLSAYVHGGELSLRGEPNVYDAAHYPGLNPDAKPHTAVAHMVVEDPYQYAPQFLLWPALALSLSHDYATMRAVWFALQVGALLFGLVGLCAFAGGRAGRLGLWLSPLAISAFPVLHDLQYGQFHLAAVGLSVAAMIAFERGRTRTGGALLATAVLSKLFPGVLLFVLAAQRRYRELVATLVFACALTAATLMVFGTSPFEAFFAYHLPRLQSGAAFAFGEAWPEVYDMVLVANQGVYGLMQKLGALGIPAAADAAVWVNRAYALALAGLALLAGIRLQRAARAQQVIAWLSLLGLASLMSTGAFADYVPATAACLSILLAHRMLEGPARFALLPAWALQYTLLGTTPVGDWFDARVMIPASVLSLLALLGLFGWGLRQALTRTQAKAARASADSWPQPLPTA